MARSTSSAVSDPPFWRIPDRGVRLPATGGGIRGTLPDSNTPGHKRVYLK